MGPVRLVVLNAVLLLATEARADTCPEDPLKTEPGLCGCGVADSDWDVDGIADSCIDPGATVPVGTEVGYRARVDSGAVLGTGVALGAHSHIGSGTSVGDRAVIATRATVGSSAQVGPDSVIGRRATVGDGASTGPDALIGREASVADGVSVSGVGQLALGYGSTLGDTVQTVGQRSVFGNLVDVHAQTIEDDVIVARSTDVGVDAVIEDGVIIGPECQIFASAKIGSGSRLRKDVHVGARSRVGANSRIGRSVDIAADACVGADARIGAQATLQTWAVVAANASVGRGQDVAGEAAAPECLNNFDSAMHFVNGTDSMRISVGTTLSNTYTVEARVMLDPLSSGPSSLWSEWTFNAEDKTMQVRPGFLSGYAYPASTLISVNTPALVVDQWHHIAWVNSGNQRYLFVDGVQVRYDTGGGNAGDSSGLGFIGGIDRAPFRAGFRGWLDSFRISSVARYTTPFTPPSGDMTSDADTLVLYNFEPDDFYLDGSTVTVQDLSPNGRDGQLATGFGTATMPVYPQ